MKTRNNSIEVECFTDKELRKMILSPRYNIKFKDKAIDELIDRARTKAIDECCKPDLLGHGW